MGCKFSYIETAFRESNPELADKLNAKHEKVLKELLKSGKYFNDNGTLRKVDLNNVDQIDMFSKDFEVSEETKKLIEEKGSEIIINLNKDPEIKDLLSPKKKNKLQEDYSNVDTSRIIYFGNHDGELKMNLEAKEPVAEVLVASKFRDSSGKLIDLYQDYNKKTGKGKYITLKNGALSLNKDMFDESLFDNFMFRTPTSSHGLGATVKIVGFLPPESGDLAITPKNFIAKMGQDFDIDKLTAYQYHTGLNKLGKIEKYKPEHIKSELNYLKNKLEKAGLMKSLKEGASQEGTYFDKSISRLDKAALEAMDFFDSLFKNYLSEDDYNSIVNDKINTIEDKLQKLEQAMNNKLSENNLIEIHNTVFKNKDKKIQKKIHKTLSMQKAEEQAEAIEKVTSKSSDSVNLLSPSYQKYKLKLGATGGIAIGIYAKGVTFHSLNSQLENPIKIKGFSIGNINVDGRLGKEKSISAKDIKSTEDWQKFVNQKARAISEVLDEKTNTATDNEKAQILGRVGLNYRESLSVDVLLSALGVDMDYQKLTKDEYDENNPFHKKEEFEGKDVYYAEYAIPYLLHSQPTIQNILKQVENTKGQLFTGNTIQVNSLINKELLNIRKEIIKETGNKDYDFSTYGMATNLTGKVLSENLEGGITRENKYALLKLYKKLLADAELYRNTLSVVDTNNLGKSLFESIEKKEKFENLLKKDAFDLDTGKYISGSSKLLGEFQFEKPDNIEDYYEIENEGSIAYFKPTTNRGHALFNAYKMTEVFDNMHPYNKPSFKEGMNNLIDKMGKGDSDYKSELKEAIFQEMRKFITADSRLGLFDNLKETRKDLFFDLGEDNQSLSTYINSLFTQNTSEVKYIKDNKMLSKMEYRSGFKGKPSLILFSNTDAKTMDEEIFKQAFIDLILNDRPLPKRNGKEYSTRKLATDLIRYSFLSGGIVQGAVDFHRFIPLDYLEDLTTEFRGEEVPILNMFRIHNTTPWKKKFDYFNIQFLQHNSHLLNTMNSEDYKHDMYYMLLKSKGNAFVLEESQGNTSIKSLIIPNQFVESKPAGFESYPIVGTFGMNEYDYSQTYIKNPISNEITEILDEYDKNNVPESNIDSIVEAFNNSGSNAEAYLKAEERRKNSTSSSDIKHSDRIGLKAGNYYNISDVIDFVSKLDLLDDNSSIKQILKATKDLAPKGGIIKVIEDSQQNFRATSNISTDGRELITLNLTNMNKNSFIDFVETLGHEYIHSITVRELTPFLDIDGNIIADAPKELQDLKKVFNTYVKYVKDNYGEEFQEFIAKVGKFKDDKSLPTNFSKFEREVLYPAYNVKEFLAITLGNNKGFIKEASTIPYSGKINLLERFGKVLENFLNMLLKNNNSKNTLAEASIYSSLNAVELLNKDKFKDIKGVDLDKNSNFEENIDDINAALAAASQELDEDSDMSQYFSENINNTNRC